MFLSSVDRAIERNASRLVIALAAAQALFYAGACWIKYHYFLYTDIDLAIFVEAMDAMLRGSLGGSIRGIR